MKQLNLETYGNWKIHVDQEGGIGEFVTSYSTSNYFSKDEDLERLAKIIENATELFYETLKAKIFELGGDPEDYVY